MFLPQKPAESPRLSFAERVLPEQVALCGNPSFSALPPEPAPPFLLRAGGLFCAEGRRIVPQSLIDPARKY
jgi:hypothetical protein